MNVLAQLASQFLEFINEFRHNQIFIGEDVIRRHLQLLSEITEEKSFQDFSCHENGIQLVFHNSRHDSRFIRFRVSFDIKILSLTLNTDEQCLHIFITNIRLKSLNSFSKAFRFCLQARARSLVTEELERICTEQHIPFQRLFKNVRCPLIYRISLMTIKPFDQLRQRYLIMGNRSILDLIQITTIEHREQALVLGYRFRTSVHDDPSLRAFLIDKQ